MNQHRGCQGHVRKQEMIEDESTPANAEALLTWLRDRESATVGEIATSGLMKSRTASDAIQYAVRSGAPERVIRADASAKERMRSRATGVALPAPRTRIVRPSFERLLETWVLRASP
jgi:hypothetical protein